MSQNPEVAVPQEGGITKICTCVDKKCAALCAAMMGTVALLTGYKFQTIAVVQAEPGPGGWLPEMLGSVARHFDHCYPANVETLCSVQAAACLAAIPKVTRDGKVITKLRVRREPHPGLLFALHQWVVPKVLEHQEAIKRIRKAILSRGVVTEEELESLVRNH